MKIKLILLAILMLVISTYGKSQNLSAINLAVSEHVTAITSVELFANHNRINLV